MELFLSRLMFFQIDVTMNSVFGSVVTGSRGRPKG